MAEITSRLWWIAKNVHRLLASEEAEVRRKAHCDLRADYEMFRTRAKECWKKFWCCDCEFREDQNKECAPQGPLVLFEASTLGILLATVPLSVPLTKDDIVAVFMINFVGAIALFLQIMVLRDRDAHNFHSLSRHSRRLAWSMFTVTLIVLFCVDAYCAVTRELPFNPRIFARAEFKTFPDAIDFEFERIEPWGAVVTARITPEMFGDAVPRIIEIHCYVPDALEDKVRLDRGSWLYEGEVGNERKVTEAVRLDFDTDHEGHYAGYRYSEAKPDATYVVQLKVVPMDNTEMPPRYKDGLRRGNIRVRRAIPRG